MNKILFNAFVFLWTCIAFSQTDYGKGYYIDNLGNKNEGYLKIVNFETVNNPVFNSLDFKNDLSSTENTKVPVENVTEFAIDNELKYQKVTVQMDDVNLYRDFNDSKDLQLSASTLFLNVLIEGQANLYVFPSNNGNKYFYKIKDQETPTQLLYKKHFNSQGLVVENNFFRQQLFNDVKCENQTFTDFLNIKHDKKELVSFFENYNKCQNSPYVSYKNKTQKGFHAKITVFAGVNFINFNLVNTHPETTAETATTFGAGSELELVTPSEKWAFFSKVEYSHANISVEGKGPLSQGSQAIVTDTYELNSGFLDMVFGLRWYQNIKNAGNFFLGSGIGINSPLDSITKTHNIKNTVVNYEFTEVREISLSYNVYFNFEIGYKFNKHFGILGFVDSNKNMAAIDNSFNTKFNRTGLNLRYTF